MPVELPQRRPVDLLRKMLELGTIFAIVANHPVVAQKRLVELPQRMPLELSQRMLGLEMPLGS
jgi:hypothetical protein